MRNSRYAYPLRVESLYPSNGLPARPGENRPGLSPFGRLAMGQGLGKSSIVIYDNRAEDVQQSPVDMLAIEGDDLDAQQLILTLHPPRVIPICFNEISQRLDKQNLTGEQTNSEVTAHDFPGDDRPIRWPPLEALIEFGVGGVATKVVVDFMNGVTLSVCASYLRVGALVTQSRRCGEIYGTSAAYYLAAHVGPGFAESHAQRTVFVGNVDNGDESSVFDVPRLAKMATLAGSRGHHRAPVRTKGWIRFWQDPKGEHCAGDFDIDGHLPGVQIPNAALYFSVFNKSGHRLKMAVIFKLAL